MGYTAEATRGILIGVAWADIIVSYALRVGRIALSVGAGVALYYAIRRIFRHG